MDQRNDSIDIWDGGIDATTVVISNTTKRLDGQNRGRVRKHILSIVRLESQETSKYRKVFYYR